jgi:hypothetical protein
VKAGLISNHANYLAACNQSIAEAPLLRAGTIGHEPAGGFLPFQFQADPWHEEEVACAGLNGACAGKEQICEGVSDCPKPQFVARLIVTKLVDELHDLTTFVF